MPIAHKVAVNVCVDNGEGEPPVEAALCRGPQLTRVHLKLVEVDAANVGHNHARAVLVDAINERLNPPRRHLAVAVQEDEDGELGLLRSAHARANNAIVDVAVEELDHAGGHAQLAQVVGEQAQLRQRAVVIDQNDFTEKVCRGAVQHADNVAEQCGQGLVVEDDDDA